jgi:hypothetical protein
MDPRYLGGLHSWLGWWNQWEMPTLSRRRVKDQQPEHWLIFSDGMHIGAIGIRSGVPVHIDQWQWTISPYPASHRGIRDGGTAPSFAEAREAFERAWREIEPRITDADSAEHRRERAHTEWKYKMWSAGCKMPTQVADGRSRCYCGAEIDSQNIGLHIAAEHMTCE